MKTETDRGPEPDGLSDHASYQDVRGDCDVVMKGGVTSGIVYPRAICRLAQRFRLRSIGGASAGAIAAACAAAAEYGRGLEAGGFARLAGLPAELGRTVSGRSRLVSLFQPAPRTRILFELLLGVTGPAGSSRKCCGAAATLVRHGGWRALVGAVVVAAFPSFVTWRAPDHWWAWTMVVLGLVVGAVLGGAWRAIVAVTRDVPAQMFGVCAGRSVAGAGGPALRAHTKSVLRAPAPGGGRVRACNSKELHALSDWLHVELQALAGLDADAPLTFDALAERGIQLEVVTTCLTHGRPYVLPGLRRTLYFDPDEFRRLFPEPVVAHLVAVGERIVADDAARDDRALEHACMHPRLPLPKHGELPVLVAVRMSLSFPLLLSAVPLWDYDWGGDGAQPESANHRRRREWRAWRSSAAEAWETFREQPAVAPEGAPEPLVPERIWFSDGGISSNFPLHLFDTPVPTRPTVAIDLRYHANGESVGDLCRVQLARDNADGIDEDWTRFVAPEAAGHGGVLAFVARIFATMQNWTDTTLAKTPGYRDRVAAVHLEADEGGMNLGMGEAQIAAIAGFGERAGAALGERFTRAGTGAELTWTGHRWVRLRTSLAAFEGWLEDFVAGVGPQAEPSEDADPATEPSYDALIQRKSGAHPTNYRLTVTQRQRFAAVLARLRELRATLPDDGEALTDRAPRPMPILRLAPRLNQPGEVDADQARLPDSEDAAGPAT